MARTVDVVIRGKNEAGAAFREAGRDVDTFSRGIGKLLNPMVLLKGVIAGLGVASLGALFQKATRAAIEHETSIGRNVTQMNKLGAAWDYVLVKLGSAILGLDQTGGFADKATTALASLGDWIERNKGTFEDFAKAILAIANGLSALTPSSLQGFTARVNSGFDDMMNRLMGRPTSGDLWQGPTIGQARGGSTTSSFQTFLQERERAAELKRQREAVDRALRDRETAARREQERVQKTFDEKILPQLSTDTTRPGILSSGVGTTGEGRPGISGPSAVPELDLGAPVRESFGALDDFRDKVNELSQDAIPTFAESWADAIQGFIGGTLSAGAALKKVFIGSIGSVLVADGKANLMQAAAILVKGLAKGVFGAGDLALAGKLSAIGSAEIALGAAFAGGGGGASGGGGGSLSAGGFESQRDEMDGSRGTATIIVQGGLLDMSDPRQADALSSAINEIGGRRNIVITGA